VAIMMIISPPFKVGKKYPKCKLRLKKGVSEGGQKKHVSLHFEGVLKTLHTKTTPGGRSTTNFSFKGESPKRYLTF
jgi:hypothetical protein